uniref:G-protein coupled receptors family 1 profile domain-containing protein n=1 Tax=Mola mola TaxID=94237 RepID=A0A3Q3X5Y2_MOLML
MNSSGRLDSWSHALSKHLITVALGCLINGTNGVFVYTYFRGQVFQRDPRYVLYIHLVINDMIMLSLSVALQILTYTVPLGFAPCCIVLLFLVTTNNPLSLAGMALERYIAVCRPLHHVHICTVRRAHVVIALTWVVSFGSTFINIIMVLTTQPLSVFSRNVICYQSNVFHAPHYKVILFSFVFLTVVVTYVKVLHAARAASGSSQASARKARNTIALHGIQLLIYMLSFLSPIINIILIGMWPHKRTNILFTSFLFVNVFPRLLSPLIYGVRDQLFSSHVRLHLCSRCSKPAGGFQRCKISNNHHT